MKHGSIFLALTLFTGGMAGAVAAATNEAAPSAHLLDGVAAQVNADTITIGEVLSEVSNSAFIELSKEEQKERLRTLYYGTLNAFIDRKLILAAAVAEERKLQSWVVDDRIQEIIDNRFDGDRNKLHTAITGRHILYDDWRKGIEEDLMLTAMRMEYVDKRVSISPRDIRGYYETNRQALMSAGGVHVGIITLVAGSDGETLNALGERVQKELNDGADFAALARKYSKDSHAEKGGDWGVVNPEEKFAGAIVKALAGLKPGQTSPFLTIGEKGYILRKIDEKAPAALTLDEAWPVIERRLRVQQSEELYREWTARLRRQNYVKTFDLPGLTGGK